MSRQPLNILNKYNPLFTTASNDVMDITDEGSPANTYLRAATLGFVAGLRSMTPLASLSRTAKLDPPPTNTVEAFLDSPTARLLTGMMASGELIGDKLPFIPSRIKPGPLFGRLGIGALAGARICRRYHQSLLIGAVLGASAAAAGSYAGNAYRSKVSEATKIPSFILGLGEDGLALALAWLAVKS